MQIRWRHAAALATPVGLEDYRRYVPPVARERLVGQELTLMPQADVDQPMNTPTGRSCRASACSPSSTRAPA